MVIEMDTMKIFPVLGLLSITIQKDFLAFYVILNNSPYLAQQSVRFHKPATLGEQIQRSSAYIKWLIKVPA